MTIRTIGITLFLNVTFVSLHASSTLDSAKVLIASGHGPDAIPILEVLLAEDSSAAPYNYFLGMCLVKEGIRIDEAVRYLEKAAVAYNRIDLDPGLGEPEFSWYYLVIAYSRLKECEKAQQRYRKFIKVYSQGDPFYPEEAKKWVSLCDEPMRMAQEIRTRQQTGRSSSAYLKDRLTNIGPKNLAVVTRDVNYTTGSVLYGVQVGAALMPNYTNTFKGLKNVGVYVDEHRVYRYVIGNLNFRSQAEELLTEVKGLGYQDAFIVDINQPERFGEEVVTLNNFSIQAEIHGKIEFRVQIGAFSEAMPKKLLRSYFQIENLKEVQEGDLTVLTTGRFDRYEQARLYRDRLIALGYADCFVTAFNRQKRIPVKVAIAYLEGMR